jgi:hypothetical protein
MKDSYYFPHDYSAKSDPKILALIEEYKAEGYGIYWCIIEMLHQEECHKLPLKQYIYIAIANQMKANAEQIENIIKHCIMVCELFVVSGDFFYSPRVIRNFEIRAEISEKRSIAGKAGAIAKQKLANTSKGKESKVKEIKEKETLQEPVWKKSFPAYLLLLSDAKKNILSSPSLIQDRILSIWPTLDIDKSLTLSIQNYWGTDAGWKNKKKCKAIEIDMVETLLKNIGKNKVFLTFGQQQPSSMLLPEKKPFPMFDVMRSKLITLLGSVEHPDLPQNDNEKEWQKVFSEKFKTW